ncbi:MAG TPA: YibE/F family protein [Candidatus Paceibacterota bacterium]|nr:YibE/F family protein [Candidatus Paceibacterota bacterium]
MTIKTIVGMIFLFSLCLLPQGLLAQEVHQEFQGTVKAEVLEILEQYERIIMGTAASTTVQQMRIVLKSGEKAGEVVRLDNDLVVLSPGDSIFVDHFLAIDGTEYYLFKDVERRMPLALIVGIFIVLVVWLSGLQGVRALLSLVLSIGSILFILIPALLAGYSPALTSLAIAGVILSVTLFLTHGFKPRVFVTFLGTFGSVLVTCLIAWVWVSWMRFTGFGDEASVYLNFASGGTLDLTGLLLGGIIIGLLGVLDDVSITQASVVQELKAANPSFGFKELYLRALRVGKDHVGSLVNTLALAYVGVSLPLILFLSYSEASMLVLINQEIVAAEILRIVVGSIGLLLAVPLTTALAAWYFKDKSVCENDACGHNHGHSQSHSH